MQGCLELKNLDLGDTDNIRGLKPWREVGSIALGLLALPSNEYVSNIIHYCYYVVL